MSHPSPDVVASACINLYATHHKFHPSPRSNGIPHYVVLAGIVLVAPGTDTPHCISLGTGSKCLPASRLSQNGDALHDSHAEIIARRGAVRWLFEEIIRATSASSGKCTSSWIEKGGDGMWVLKAGVSVHMYVSTLPCGDASTLSLSLAQEPEMAALKSTSSDVRPTTVTGASRGRDNYSALGVLRTKPGRADSPPTLSMSCSDKIAAWTLLGIQGALLSDIMRPVYLNSIIIGEVEVDARRTVLQECERAFVHRLRTHAPLPELFSSQPIQILFTDVSFPSSRSQSVVGALSSYEAFSWIADVGSPEVLVDGIKRGVSTKHRHLPNKRPRICKSSIYELYSREADHIPQRRCNLTYYATKQSIIDYQAAKRKLREEGGPLWGWIVSGEQWENFTL
ncbi:hypothetical protein BOTBODRAFT_121766 [Botryobasidium botryosum FD-172 SS1]|uniref:A to I editase domain-containing protein n=1 Tax=Botryobasidium botryosum (strain FD-172 SS1) TaxID=930990 RepID=A0A067M306_BOTB1|nr:hypothetical protein BOTBODRAFT_121766 [Botryobasidium botryosum FD-172 SS1]